MADNKLLVSNGPLNIRDAPRNGAVIAQAPIGAVLWLLDRAAPLPGDIHPWIKVQYYPGAAAIEGWVAETFTDPFPDNPLLGLKLGRVFTNPYVRTSAFNAPREYANKLHEGSDYDLIGAPADSKEDVLCLFDGVVTFAGWRNNAYGFRVIVKHENNNATFYTWYCHLDNVKVQKDQQIRKGDPVGELGGTGGNWAEHAHINLQVPGYGLSGYTVPDVVDPHPYIDVQDAAWQAPSPPFVDGWAWAASVEVRGVLLKVRSGFINLRADSNSNSHLIGRVSSNVIMTFRGDGVKTNGYYPVHVPQDGVEVKKTSYYGPAIAQFVPGVDQPASDSRWPEAEEVFEQTGLAPKFHTNGINPTKFAAFRDPNFNVARILLNRGFNQRDPQQIFDEISNSGAIQPFWDQGLRDFILLNEENNAHEHLGKLWDDAIEFGHAYKALSRLITEQFTGIRLWSCGFSPGGLDATPPAQKPQHAFINAAKSVNAFKYCHGWTEHVYTGVVGDKTQAVNIMIAEVKDFQKQHALDKPLLIGEFSVNRPAAGTYKAEVYKAFYQALANISGIQAAYSFTSSWHGSPDENEEGWLENGIHTAYANL